MTRLALIALGAALAATSAAASERQTFMAVRLEVSRDASDAALLRRLNETARSMCARTASPLLPGHEGRAWKCRRDAIAAALGRRGSSSEL